MLYQSAIALLSATLISNLILSPVVTAFVIPLKVNRGKMVRLSARKKASRAKAKANNMGSFIPEADLERAVDCADHFGKCSPQELEHLKNELHVDRVKLFVDESAGMASPLDFNEELGRRLLEDDLELQLAILNDEITLPMDGTVALSEKNWNQGHNNRQEIQSFINQSVMSFMADSFVVCLAIVVVMFLPHLIHS